MRGLKKFGKGLLRMAWSNDWFHWFMLSGYVFFGLVGGIVWSELEREINR